MIDHDIPIPPIDRGTGRKPKYPLADLNIGDSIFCLSRPATDFWQKKTGFRLVVRAVVENDRKGRIWRVAA